MTKENLKFKNDDFWVMKEGNMYRVGLSLDGLQSIGDISFIDLPDLGEINEGDPFLHVEASKVASEFSSPLSGNISKVNRKLLEEMDRLSLHDSNKNWIAVFKEVKDTDALN